MHMSVTIGTPPQLVHLAPDVFSNQLWVDPDCDTTIYACEACNANGHYNPNTSTTAEVDDDCGDPFSVSSPPYADASGCNVVDDVHFAGTFI